MEVSRSLLRVKVGAVARTTAIAICLTPFAWITLARADSAVELRPPETRDGAGARPLEVRAPREVVASPTLPVAGPILAVNGRLLPVDGLTPPEPPGPGTGFRAYVYFDFTKATPKHLKPIRQIAAAIKSRGPVAGLRIDGYADALGSRAYNLDLSLRRSCNVALELSRRLARRTPPMEIRAFGEAYPAAPNAHPGGSDDPDGRARNRRVEVMIVPNPSPTRLMCSVPDRPSR